MRFYYWIYTFLALIAFIFLLPYMLGRMVLTGRYREAFCQLLGFWPQKEIEKIGDKGCIWIHAVSVGEAVAASAIIKEIKKLNKEEKILVSTVTETGQRMARKIIPEADAFIYFPLDFPWLGKKALQIFRPKLFAMVETELWPNFLRESKKAGVINIMINGRISNKSLRRYRYLDTFFAGIFQDMLSKVTLFSMQSQIDQEHILALGAEKSKVLLTGNTKFDQSYGELAAEEKASLLADFGLQGHPIWVVGSTHKGEEEAILATFQKIKELYPQYRLILAPRHLDRIGEIEGLCKKYSFSPVRRTFLPQEKAIVQDIIILDTIGELGKVYGLAEIVYVGGSLVPTGGHNLLEPAAQGKPVFFGPHMDNFKETTELVLQHRAGIQVKDQDALQAEILHYLAMPEKLRVMGKNAEQMVEENKGASLRNAQIILEYLKKSPKTTQKTSPWEDYLLDIVSGRRQGMREKLVLLALSFLSILYQIGIASRLWFYQIGLKKSYKLPCSVISIGNITVGGTGKTPTTQMLAKLLQKEGLKPAILNRGYRSSKKGEMAVVSDGKKIYLSPQDAGDEAYMLASSLPEVPVLIGKNRVATGQYAYEKFAVDVLILDDGYQYWKLKRDLNVLLVDVTNPFSNNKVLPRGLLREPLQNLSRAHVFLLSKANYMEEKEKEKVRSVLREKNKAAPIWEIDYRPSYLRSFHGTDTSSDFNLLQGKKILAFSGISNPYFFECMLEHCGISEMANLRFPDHYNYTLADMQEISKLFANKKLDLIVTTEKDAVSIPKEWQADLPLWVLGIEVKPEKIEEKELTKLILDKLGQQRRNSDASGGNYSGTLSID